MQLRSIIKGLVAFVVALLVSVFVADLLSKSTIPDPGSVTVNEGPRSNLPVVPEGAGSSGPDRGTEPGDKVAEDTPCAGTCGLKIVSKPKPSYTDLARQNNIQGSVTLRITFLASGQIGAISPVGSLPDGLTEQAIAAARNIRFQPATKEGIPYTVVKTFQYSFSIY